METVLPPSSAEYKEKELGNDSEVDILLAEALVNKKMGFDVLAMGKIQDALKMARRYQRSIPLSTIDSIMDGKAPDGENNKPKITPERFSSPTNREGVDTTTKSFQANIMEILRVQEVQEKIQEIIERIIAGVSAKTKLESGAAHVA
jgi:hypothetical protein